MDHPPQPSTLVRAVKRSIDIIAAAAIGVLALPVLVMATLLLLVTNGRPVLFIQERAGLEGNPFRVVKLRTMHQHAATPVELGQVTDDHPLVTPVGRLVRRLKLDELPQLANVLRGHMSLVGPRPTLPEQADGYDEFERQRLSVRPGLTGWAQVNGNTALEWPHRIALDVWYVHHCSLRLDLRILLRTVIVLVRGELVDTQSMQEALTHANDLRRRRGLEPYRALDAPRGR